MIFQIPKTVPRLLSVIVFSLSVSIATMLTSCDNNETSETTEKHYYDLKGILNEQISMLTATKPNVEKVAVLGSQTETIRTNELDWKKELELFMQADINKPSYLNSYTVKKPDPGIIEYRIKDGVKLPLQFLRIVLDTLSGKPRHMTAQLVSQNRIYESQKNLEMRFEDKDNRSKITSYSVSGYQQLALLDRKTFRITTKIGF